MLTESPLVKWGFITTSSSGALIYTKNAYVVSMVKV